MKKTEKKTIEETKDNEIVELKDEDMSTIVAGADDSAILMSDALLVAAQAAKLTLQEADNH
ncbi:MAG: hypothetical protein MJ250_08755 [Alphaproteobacteria bacterium]|nr:hypothetical protein [Alphaproteobacteria bacterium]